MNTKDIAKVEALRIGINELGELYRQMAQVESAILRGRAVADHKARMEQRDMLTDTVVDRIISLITACGGSLTSEMRDVLCKSLKPAVAEGMSLKQKSILYAWDMIEGQDFDISTESLMARVCDVTHTTVDVVVEALRLGALARDNWRDGVLGEVNACEKDVE